MAPSVNRRSPRHDLHPPTAASFADVLSFPLVWGAIGVPIFFVLSGYVIHRRAALSPKTSVARFSPPNFLMRRFVRIYPTLVGALIVTLVCDLAARSLVAHDENYGPLGWQGFLGNLAALQGVVCPPYGSNDPLWSLSIEIQFYLLYPIALLCARRLGRWKMLLAALLFSAAGYGLAARTGFIAFPQYYFTWWLGAFLAESEAAAWKLPRFWWAGAGLALAAGCALTLAGQTFFAFNLWALGVAPILYAIITRGALVEGALAGALRFVGKFSYSLYAIHMPLVVLASVVIFHAVKQPGLLPVVAVWAATVPFAYLFYLAVERPSVRLLGKMPH